MHNSVCLGRRFRAGLDGSGQFWGSRGPVGWVGGLGVSHNSVCRTNVSSESVCCTSVCHTSVCSTSFSPTDVCRMSVSTLVFTTQVCLPHNNLPNKWWIFTRYRDWGEVDHKIHTSIFLLPHQTLRGILRYSLCENPSLFKEYSYFQGCKNTKAQKLFPAKVFPSHVFAAQVYTAQVFSAQMFGRVLAAFARVLCAAIGFNVHVFSTQVFAAQMFTTKILFATQDLSHKCLSRKHLP